jgi:tRNA (guanine-N7-)-methyltransferase
MTPTKKTFYGRRRGRPLRELKGQLFTSLLPRLTLECRENDKDLQVDSFFKTPAPEYWLEIGFGGGEHLAAHVQANPQVHFVGSEVFINGVASLLQHLQEEDYDRVRLYPDDVREFLPRLSAGQFSRIFVMFPDPWPKARHHKRRLLKPVFLAELARLLVPGGVLHIASDHAGYVEEILENIPQVPALCLQGTPDTWARPFFDGAFPTRYEGKAKEAGRVCSYFELLKK